MSNCIICLQPAEGKQVCSSCMEELDRGLIGMVEIHPDTHTTPTMHIEATPRTGSYGFISPDAWVGLVNLDVPDTPIVFVEYGVLQRLQETIQPVMH